jgi:hypothetical protein
MTEAHPAHSSRAEWPCLAATPAFAIIALLTGRPTAPHGRDRWRHTAHWRTR